MKRYRRGLLVLAWASLAATAQAGEVQLKQPDGTVLSFGGQAQRIITLSPHLTEIVFAAGAGDRLVATVEYSDFPEAATAVPRIGDAFRIDMERIVGLNPDLVIAWGSGTPLAAITQMESLGVPVWSVEITEPIEIAEVLDRVGELTGRSEQAGRVSSDIRQRLMTLNRRYEGVTTLDYFYQIGTKPLFTINGQHLISKGLHLCGGRNIYSTEPGLAFQVSYESVIVADPDAMFAPFSERSPDPLAGWQEWPDLQAVSHQALFTLPADPVSRASPRFLDSLELACKLLHQLREQKTNG